MARVLLLTPTSSYRAGDFLAAARRLGLDVTVASDDLPAFDGSPEGLLRLPLDDQDACVRRIVAFAARRPLSAVVGTDEATCVLAARAAESLRLPHSAPGAVGCALDKHRFRRALEAAGVPGPRHRVVTTASDVAPELSGIRYPCVAKPLAGAAGRGVIRADDPHELAAAIRRIESIERVARSPRTGDDPARDAGDGAGTPLRVLVEDFLPGAEVALEGVLWDGRLRVLALFDKPDVSDGPFFEETLYVTPSRLPRAWQAACAEATQASARALGLRHGPVHAELRVRADGAWPLEVAPRTIGGLCSRALRFGAGVTLEEIVLGQALGGEGAAPGDAARAGGVLMIPIPRAGYLRAVRGLDAAAAVPDVADVVVTARPGQRLAPPPDGGAYLGFVFARSDSPEAAERALRTAGASLLVEVAPANDPARWDSARSRDGLPSR